MDVAALSSDSVESGVAPSVDRVVWASVAALFMSSENHQRMHDVADELRLTPALVKALLELEPGAARPMRDLAEQWRCDASFVTVVVDGLEERGLVERRVLPTDRRVKTVELTAAGIAGRDRVLSAVCAPRAALEALTAREQHQLARLLLKLARAQVEDGPAGSATRAWLSAVEGGASGEGSEVGAGGKGGASDEGGQSGAPKARKAGTARR